MSFTREHIQYPIPSYLYLEADLACHFRGLPPYHPFAIEESWDPAKVDNGVRKDTIELVQAGYNVYGRLCTIAVWYATAFDAGLWLPQFLPQGLKSLSR